MQTLTGSGSVLVGNQISIMARLSDPGPEQWAQVCLLPPSVARGRWRQSAHIDLKPQRSTRAQVSAKGQCCVRQGDVEQRTLSWAGCLVTMCPRRSSFGAIRLEAKKKKGSGMQRPRKENNVNNGWPLLLILLRHNFPVRISNKFPVQHKQLLKTRQFRILKIAPPNN